MIKRLRTSKASLAARARFEKDYTALKQYLLGRWFIEALSALSFAEEYHTGMRKDGYTPEFHHQLLICFTILNLKGIEQIEERCIVRALLHDVMEDYDIDYEVLCEQFGEETADDVYSLSKKHKGEVKSVEQYHEELSCKPELIIVKGADNSHNVQSMYGAFKFEKMESYLADTKEHKLPLIRLGRKRFPRYHFAFTGLSFMLKRQVELYEHFLKTTGSQERFYKAELAGMLSIAQAESARMGDLEERVKAGTRLVGQSNVEKRTLEQSMQFEKSKYQNFAAAVVEALDRLSVADRETFWRTLMQRATTNGTRFDMPTSLLGSFVNAHGNGIDEIPDNSKPAGMSTIS